MKYSICFLAIVLYCCAQAQQQKLMFEPKTKLHYLVHEPTEPTAKTPLILLLHGYGSNENDLFAFSKQFPPNYLTVSVRAPIAISDNSFAWYHVILSKGKQIYNEHEAEESRIILLDFLKQLKLTHDFDITQVYIVGFSQGAIMSYSIALTTPNLAKGIAALSGRILEETKPIATKNLNNKKLSIFISHGVNDDVLGIENARNADMFLKTIGINASYHEYEATHTINTYMFSDLLAWLKKQ